MRPQLAPASVVRRMVPARPTIQQTVSEGADPAVRSANTLLVCRNHEAPLSLEYSIMPDWPARQRDFPPGAAITNGRIAAAIRKTVLSLKAATGAGAGGGASAAGVAAAPYAGARDFALRFPVFSSFLD